MAGAGTEFDLDAVKTLMRYVPGYPTGTVVRLSGGRHRWWWTRALRPGRGCGCCPATSGGRARSRPPRRNLERARAEIEELDLAGLYTMTIEAVLE